MRLTSVFLFLLFFSFTLFSQETENRNYNVFSSADERINIDGKLDEPVWLNANWENKFIQHEPYEGKEPSQQTEYAILNDDNNLYVAIKAFDKSPDSISMRLTRRNETDGDMVGIFFDTYHDLRTAFGFIVSAAGVKSDMVQSNDGANEDMTWDPIWWVKTTKNEQGWIAEMRIPLTQLRFEEGEEQKWGLQVVRYIFRKDELSTWQLSKREKSGFVSQFGTLSGLSNIKPKNSLNITPYVVARTERFEKVPENPFRANGKANDLNAGLDAKIGLTNYLTMDLTINPDFGQVEADPSEVNLSTYETFFEEKRPFFIEGKSILQYNLQFGDGQLASEGLFYSRRIGRRPQHYPSLQSGEYAQTPDFTSILGAAKITGKTQNGWSIGVLESVTSEETAKIKGIGEGRTAIVDPLTNFFVGRVQKDFNEGNTYLGGMFTAVNRSDKHEHLNFLHKSAYTGGFDFVHRWNDRNWMMDLGAYFSNVNGTTEAIDRTQRSYIRNYRRPDADYVTYDPNRTSLFGHGGKFSISKLGGRWNVGSIISWKSPGLEVNDVGFAQQVDRVLQVIWSGYNFYEPFSIFRNMRFNFNQFAIWDFGGNRNTLGFNLSGRTQLSNFWRVFGSINYSGEQQFNSALRGGPALKIPGYKNAHFGVFSNPQKKFTIGFNGGTYISNEKDFRNISNWNISLGYRPMKSLRIEVEPGISQYKDELMYVGQRAYNSDMRYIMSNIKRNTIQTSFRINYNISPDLTIQYWGQPFIASGEYSAFKHITDSKAENLTDRYNSYSSDQISFNADWNAYVIDENRDGNIDYTIGKPDFNVKEFLSNFVVRWEYRPGSTVYLVWSQTRNQYINDGTFELSNDLNQLFGEKANNIFLVKFSYRLGR